MWERAELERSQLFVKGYLQFHNNLNLKMGKVPKIYESAV